MHAILIHFLQKDKEKFHVLKTLSVLIEVTPYQKMHTGLLFETIDPHLSNLFDKLFLKETN